MPAGTPRQSTSKPNQSTYGRAPSPPLASPSFPSLRTVQNTTDIFIQQLRPVPIRPKPATLQRPSSRRPASPSRIQPPPLSISIPRPSPSYRFPTPPSSRPRSSSVLRSASIMSRMESSFWYVPFSLLYSSPSSSHRVRLGAYLDESRPPPDSYLRVTKDLYHSYVYTRRLYDSWSSESSGEPLSLSLRRRAQQMADKEAWFMLNRRARALLEGIKIIQDAQERLVDHLTTYLDVSRSRNGISTFDYLEYYNHLQPLLPSSRTARPNPRLVPRPSSARRPSPTRTFPKGILRDPSPEGAFEGRGSRVGRSVRPCSPSDSRLSSVERYGRTG
ncbi:hypothetical protein JCM5353_003995 [Sporobolomyces roseus]